MAPPKRKTKTGTENAAGSGTLEELAAAEGVSSSEVEASKERIDSAVAVADNPEVEESTSDATASPQAEDLPDPCPVAKMPESAAPASMIPSAPVQAPATAYAGKRNLDAGAIHLDDIPNEFITDDAEMKAHMEEEVTVLCLKDRTLGIGLRRWAVKDRVSYIIPRWFALDKRDTFVIQGQ